MHDTCHFVCWLPAFLDATCCRSGNTKTGTLHALFLSWQARPAVQSEQGMNHLRFLRYVDEVARTGSVRQAAERLYVAPSAVIRRIQDLEEELGTAIFERLPRGMRLTSAGELFVAYIRSRTADLERVRSEIEELQGMRRGVVRIACSQALAPSFLPRSVALFRETHPRVAFQIRVTDRVQAMNALRAFETDLVVVFDLAPDSDIERLGEYEQKLRAMMHRSHPLATRTGLRLRDCTAYPLALPNRDLGGRQLIQRFLARSSLRFEPAIESNSFEILRGYLQHEQAISFQIGVGTIVDNPDIVARPIEDRGFPGGHLILASLRGRQLPIVAYAFAEHLKCVLGKLNQA